jgi:predicted TIM-barrel fold metal-dependent hydrolase
MGRDGNSGRRTKGNALTGDYEKQAGSGSETRMARTSQQTRRSILRASAFSAIAAASSSAGGATMATAVKSDRQQEQARRVGRVIDVHSHALLPRWLDAVSQATRLPRDRIQIAGTPVPEWSVEHHLSMMEAHGIAACVLSWPSATAFLKGDTARALARAMNEEFASIIARHPKRFGAFAVLPLDDMDAAIEEMRYALDVLKLDGVSSSTHVGGVYLGDARYDNWFAEMNRRATTLFVHPTIPLGSELVSMGLNVAILEFMFDSTRMATNMVLSGAKQRFADIRMICTHGGGTVPYLASRVSILEPVFGAGPNRAVLSAEDILKGLSTFYFDLTASTAAASLDAIRHLVPSSQLMLGFDFPMMPAATVAPGLSRFDDYCGLTMGDRVGIIRDNALSLLPGLADRIG